MLVSMSDKELKRLSVLQEIYDQRITQSQAAQLLHISERQIRRLLQKYKAQGPAALAHAARGQISNSRLPEELRLKCLNIVSDQLHGFGPTLAGTVAKLAMRQPFVLFKGLTFQKLCLPGAFRPGDHHNKMLRPGLCVVHASPQYL